MEGTEKLEICGGWLKEAPASCRAYPEVEVNKPFKFPITLANKSFGMEGAKRSGGGAPREVATAVPIGKMAAILTTSGLEKISVGCMSLVEHLSNEYFSPARLASRLASLASRCTKRPLTSRMEEVAVDQLDKTFSTKFMSIYFSDQ